MLATTALHPHALAKRGRSAWKQVPFFTKVTLVACVGFHLLVLWKQRDLLGDLCLSADSLVYRHDFGRILLAPLFHEGWRHLLVNMVAVVWIGSSLEKLVGTLNLAFLNSMLAIFGAVLFVIMAYALANNPIKADSIAPYECVAGMSGVLFGQLAVECKMLGSTKRSLFGLVMVPAKWYPVVTLLAVRVIAPDASFPAHLSGLIVGTMYAYGMLDSLKLDGPLVEYVESFWPLRKLAQRSDYFTHDGRTAPSTSQIGLHVDLLGWTMRLLRSLAGRMRIFRRRRDKDVRAEDFPGEGHRLGTTDSKRSSTLPTAMKSNRQSGGASSSGSNLTTKDGKVGWVTPQDKSPGEAFRDARYEDKVAVLVEMGFEANVAREALEAAGGDVPTAAESLSP